LVTRAIQCVCRTFDSDPQASATLLRRVLQPERLAQYGFEELPWLAREVKRLIPVDAAFVGELYRAAFEYREQSQDPTAMGTSRILPLISNRRQDYEHGLYVLTSAFPEFLAKGSAWAVSALISAIEVYVTDRHHALSGEESFDFNGEDARLAEDYSVIWGHGGVYRHDEPIKMLEAFEHHLERLAERDDTATELREIVGVIVRENRRAVIWQKLLHCGARFPHTLGKQLLPLASAVPILSLSDTSTVAGEFLSAIFPNLGVVERDLIERALLSLPEVLTSIRTAERVRDRLLGCLAEADLVTDGARRLLADLRARQAIPPNEPEVRFGVTAAPYGEEEYLADEGVPVEAEANRNVRDLERPVRQFVDRPSGSAPSPSEIETVLPTLQALRAALATADTDGVHPRQRDHAWGELAGACALISKSEMTSCSDPAGRFLRDVLLEGSTYPEPRPDPQNEAGFDEGPSWSSPAARINVAEGLTLLARHSTCADDEVIAAIENLSRDPVRAVRYQVARRLHSLWRTAPDVMWHTVEHLCSAEESRGVLQGLIVGPLDFLAGQDGDRVARLIGQLFERTREGAGARKVRDLCIDILVSLYLWRDHLPSGRIILEIAEDPVVADDAYRTLTHLRSPLTHGPVSPPDPVQDAIRRRAVDLADRLLGKTIAALDAIQALHADAPFSTWPEPDREHTLSLMRLLDLLGSELYFASGAFELAKSMTSNEGNLSPEVRERFYREVGPMLEQLADVGLPSVTHHLLETLETLVSIDPRGVFLKIGRIVRSGAKGGYQYEQLAADLLVKLVERYLAEHRVLLRDDEACRQALLEILDIFVKAGWPSAQRLTYRLDEIFR
jgi:hypothetical protein